MIIVLLECRPELQAWVFVFVHDSPDLFQNMAKVIPALTWRMFAGTETEPENCFSQQTPSLFQSIRVKVLHHWAPSQAFSVSIYAPQRPRLHHAFSDAASSVIVFGWRRISCRFASFPSCWHFRTFLFVSWRTHGLVRLMGKMMSHARYERRNPLHLPWITTVRLKALLGPFYPNKRYLCK